MPRFIFFVILGILVRGQGPCTTCLVKEVKQHVFNVFSLLSQYELTLKILHLKNLFHSQLLSL